MSFLHEDFGGWAVTASIGYLFLSDGPGSRHGGDDFEVMASISFGLEF